MTAPLQGVRFAPPSFVLGLEHRWLLLRAFGPPDSPCDAPPADAACRLALASGLAPRIAARTAGATLDRELATSASELRAASRQAVAHCLAYEEVVRAMSVVARRLDLSLALLKGFALNAAGFSASGSREVGDLDVLVEADSAEALYAALSQAGFDPSSGHSNEHHLAPLRAPTWGVVDLHFSLRGVGDEKGRWLSANQALALGEPVEVQPACWVPDREVLAAHAIAHAIEQHATSPNPYPLLRAVGDLIDLFAARGWHAATPNLAQWLRDAVSPAEIKAMKELCLGLEAGQIPGPSQPARRLLDHFLAHRFDDEYRAGLAGQHRRHRLLQAWQRGTLLRYVGRKVSGLWHRP